MTVRYFLQQLPTKLDPLEQYESWNEANAWSIPWQEITKDDYVLLVLAGSVTRASVEHVSSVGGIELAGEPATWIYARDDDA